MSSLTTKGVTREQAAPFKRLFGWLQQTQTGAVLLPLLGLALSVLCEKVVLFYFTASLRHRFFQFSTGGPEVAPGHSFWAVVSLLRSDLLYSFVVIPLIFCLLTARLSPRWRIALATVFTFCVQAVIILEIFSYLISDAFSSLLLMWFSVHWEIETHQFVIHRAALALTAADLAAILLSGIAAAIVVKKNLRWLSQAVLAAFGLGAAATALAYVFAGHPTAPSQSLLWLTIRPAFSAVDTSFSLDRRTAPELLHAYRELARVSPPHTTAFTGKAKNYNVVFFVLEAIAAQAIDPARDPLSDMPHLRAIRESSFVMGRHYTSYPQTANASFSIFTSIYNDRPRQFLDQTVELPGVIRALRNRGYATEFAGFVWDDPTHSDYPLLQSIGFEKIAAPSAGSIENSFAVFGGPVEYVEKLDHNSLLALMADIHNWTAHGQRFAAAFFPEMGHDPYRALNSSAAGHQSALERARSLAAFQDAWLGELLDELTRDGAIDNTILVFTSDHGMRFMIPPKELRQPSLVYHFTTLDETMLRVPMLIDVPGVLAHPVFINDPTDHVDIAPTVLDLLGVSTGKELEQGLPVYDPEIAERRLFLDMKMYGASGYYSDGEYHSYSTLGAVFESPTLNFDTHDLVPYDSREAESVRRIMDTYEADQGALLNRILAGHSSGAK